MVDWTQLRSRCLITFILGVTGRRLAGLARHAADGEGHRAGIDGLCRDTLLSAGAPAALCTGLQPDLVPHERGLRQQYDAKPESCSLCGTS